ncbi:purine nucleoside phosphorylase-like isoform X2 [Rhynchophorus ferrugineus]|uniref:purine nucleoside phosphorylase-like isoform X2 n=1 Tax=Rhynchophorus ferrugineus TaxID=354439 RepID=UPI003FCE4D27
MTGIPEVLDNPIVLNYNEIPTFPLSTVQGHAGKLVFGTLNGVKIVCMKGRFHYFEGYSIKTITKPIRIMKLLGVKAMFATNAAGSLNPKFQVGDIMVLRDHLNMLSFGGENPLRGPNDSRFGERFTPMNKAYDRQLIKIAHEVAKDIGLADNCHEGVFAIVSGPNYESVAEARALSILGADTVGMSTVPEVLVARHCGMAVFAFSFITNRCIVSYEENDEPNHRNILNVADQRSEKVKEFVCKIIEKSQERWL